MGREPEPILPPQDYERQIDPNWEPVGESPHIQKKSMQPEKENNTKTVPPPSIPFPCFTRVGFASKYKC